MPNAALIFPAESDWMPPMDLRIEGLKESTHWRIYCRAVEHGRSVNEEILAILDAGQVDIPPDPAARLAAAREIRQMIESGTTADA